MASGLFVDPTTLLRLTPLISSTCTLWFAWDQRVMYSTFTHPDLRNESSAILPLWWRKVLDLHEIERVLLPVTITTVASIVNIRKHGALLRAKGSWAWYAAGAALAVGQYVLLQHRRFCFQAAFGESLVDVSGLLKPGDWLWLSTAVAYVPGVMYKIQAMIEDNGKGEAVEQQRRWLRVHNVRTLTVDLGAWLACLIAVARTVS